MHKQQKQTRRTDVDAPLGVLRARLANESKRQGKRRHLLNEKLLAQGRVVKVSRRQHQRPGDRQDLFARLSCCGQR